MTFELLRNTVGRVRFRDWEFRMGALGDGWFVQVAFDAPCTVTGAVEQQRGRKYYISPFAIPDEVIKTCWVAIESALKHEAMEDFIVDGVAPFHPHTDIETLIENQHEHFHVHREKR